jgi:hypothetical protein
MNHASLLQKYIMLKFLPCNSVLLTGYNENSHKNMLSLQKTIVMCYIMHCSSYYKYVFENICKLDLNFNVDLQ